ncbi:tetratricopeptide repeat protein [Kitasatospora cineracea]|uniref:tetratricopeptide repeat protein n=1 Tax=Kitasatospora cineracea TaxID=88074 RepID=UPI00341396E3
MTWPAPRNEIGGGTFHGPVHQAGTVNVAAPRTPRPALGGLPPGAGRFVGREDESALLDAALAADGGAVVAVVGPPGVGKTELAVQAARRTGARVLFVDLAGYDPERRLAPAEALDGFLHALGLPPEDIPPALQDKSRAYRSLLADTAGPPVLVVLDNAFSAEQLAPLLPGGNRANTLITSRHTPAVDARLLELAVLDGPSAVALLDSVLRTARPEDARLARHPDAAAELARLCEGLPLALRVAAALLADTPTRPPSSLVAALRDERTRLRRLRHRELAVRAAFALSYAHLSPDAARVFRLFALNPGPDLATSTVAAAVEADGPDAEELLAELAQAHLVEAGEPWGRWRMHDLMRLFAAEQGRDEQVQDRLHAHYLGLVGGRWEPERRNLVALAVAEPPVGRPETTVALAALLGPRLRLRQRPGDALAVLTAALAVVRPRPDVHLEATLRLIHGGVLMDLGRYGAAEAELRCAADLFARAGERVSEGLVLLDLGDVLSTAGRYRESEEVLRRAGEYIAGSVEPWLSDDVAVRLSDALIGTGRHLEALELLRTAERNRRAAGDREHAVEALFRQRTPLLRLGRTREALEAGLASAELCAELGDRVGQVYVLADLAGSLRRTDQADRVPGLLQQALALALDLGGHPLMCAAVELVPTHYDAGRYAEALDAADTALALVREYGVPRDEATVRGHRAGALEQLGRPAEALAEARAAAALFEELADPPGRVWALEVQLWLLTRADRTAEAEAVEAEIAELRPPAR